LYSGDVNILNRSWEKNIAQKNISTKLNIAGGWCNWQPAKQSWTLAATVAEPCTVRWWFVSYVFIKTCDIAYSFWKVASTHRAYVRAVRFKVVNRRYCK